MIQKIICLSFFSKCSSYLIFSLTHFNYLSSYGPASFLSAYPESFPPLLSGLGSESITGRDYLSLLQNHKPALQWDTESSEHFFLYNDDRSRQRAVFYPSLKSIYLRLQEARSLGASLSIWEIGQGLDYFFDLL